MVSGLPGRVPEHHVVGEECPPGRRLADGDVEQHLAAEGDVALGAVVEVLCPLALQDVHDGRAIDVTWVKLERHGAES